MRQITRVIVGGVLLVCGGSAYAAQSGVSKVDAAWVKAMKAEDSAAAASCYDKNALLWVTGAPLSKSVENIQAAYKDYFAAFKVNDVSVTELGSETIGNKSVAWGTYKLTSTPKAGGASVTTTGRYTEIAKREGKRWVYTVDHASDDPASPVAK